MGAVVSTEWEITSLKTKTETNSEGASLADAVVQVYWAKKCKDSAGKEGVFYGATPFTATNTPEGSFKAFSSLTEADVLVWVKAIADVAGSYKDHIDEKIAEQLEDAPAAEKDLPWA